MSFLYTVYRCDGKNQSGEFHINSNSGPCTCGRPTEPYEPSPIEMYSYISNCLACTLSADMRDCTNCLFKAGLINRFRDWYFLQDPEYLKERNESFSSNFRLLFENNMRKEEEGI
jgi:hypothetical protein